MSFEKEILNEISYAIDSEGWIDFDLVEQETMDRVKQHLFVPANNTDAAHNLLHQSFGIDSDSAEITQLLWGLARNQGVKDVVAAVRGINLAMERTAVSWLNDLAKSTTV